MAPNKLFGWFCHVLNLKAKVESKRHEIDSTSFETQAFHSTFKKLIGKQANKSLCM